MISDEILQKILNRDKDAFSIFYTEVVDSFFRYIKNMYFIGDSDIYDIISITFYKIWNSLDSFNMERWSFNSWTRQILKNTVKDFFKKHREFWFSEFEKVNDDWSKMGIEDMLVTENDMNEILTISANYKKIEETIATLSLQDREILTLRYVEEKKLDEIKDILNISYANARVKLHRAMNKLKQKLK